MKGQKPPITGNMYGQTSAIRERKRAAVSGGERNTVVRCCCLVEEVVVAVFTDAERMEGWDRR